MNAVGQRPPADPRVRTCPHHPACPPYWATDALAAKARVRHPEQGWTLLCNGVVVFDDTDLPLLPDQALRQASRP